LNSKYQDSFRIGIHKQISQSGNAYYDYSQNGIPFPDGLSTLIKVQESIVPLGKISKSNKGNNQRVGTTNILIGGVLYDVTAYLTETKNPYYVKLFAKKISLKKVKELKVAYSPKGGAFI
jgi:hypothetical protein